MGMKKIIAIIAAVVFAVSCSVDNGYDHTANVYRMTQYSESLFNNGVLSDAIELEYFLLVDCYLKATPEERTELPQIKNAQNWLYSLSETDFRYGFAGRIIHTRGTDFFDKDCKWTLSKTEGADEVETGYKYQGDSTWVSPYGAVLRFYGWNDKGNYSFDITPKTVIEVSETGLNSKLEVLDEGTIRFTSGEEIIGRYRVDIFRGSTEIDWIVVDHTKDHTYFHTSKGDYDY